MKPIVSIITPTKNRYKYLKYLISLIDSFGSDEIELVVQDNSDNNEEIVEYLNENNYPCVKYFYSSDKLSMSGNSDLALQNSTGEYVCFIGDDDGVCRNIIDCVHWMKKNNIDAVRTSKTGYFWGDYNKKKLRDDMSRNVVYKQPRLSYRYTDPIKELKSVLKKGFQNPKNIPFLYTGIVKRSILDKIYRIGGTCFPGGSPDMSNGVSLCFFVKKYAIVDIPVVITGTSNMTGGGVHRKKGQITHLEDVGFISQKVIDEWEDSIPRIWAGRLAWPESGIKGLRYTNHEEFLQKMNYDYMFANFALYHYQYTNVAYNYAPNKLKFVYYLFILSAQTFLRILKNKSISIIKKRANGLIKQEEINDIIEAEKFLTENTENFKFNHLN